MSIESKLDKLNALLGELIRTLQQDANMVAPPEPQQQMQAPPAQQMQAPPAQQMQPPPMQQNPMQPPPMAAPAAGVPAAPTAAQATGAPPAPSAGAPAPGGLPPMADNVVQMPAASGPAITREQLNAELMAVVAQLGGGPAAAEKVMGLMVQKYGTGSLQGIDESQYPTLLQDVKALVGG